MLDWREKWQRPFLTTGRVSTIRHFSYFRRVLIHPPIFFLFLTHTRLVTDNGGMYTTTDLQNFYTLDSISECYAFLDFFCGTRVTSASVLPPEMWQALDTQMFPPALSQKCPKLPPDNLDLPRNDICQLGTDGFIFPALFWVFQTKLQLQRFQE